MRPALRRGAGGAARGGGRFDAIDGLRAVAALSVLAYHVALASGLSHSEALSPLVAELKAGVGVFFVISGFVLYLPYARAIQTRASLPDWRGFAVRRVTRIFPAYWIALTALAVASPSSVVLGTNSWRYYLLTQVYDPNTILSGLPVAWSLCVEVSFYLALPFFALGVRRLTRHRSVLAPQLLVLAALGGASLLLRLAVTRAVVGEVPHSGFVLETALPGFVDWFAIGMALAAVRGSLEDGSRLPAAVWWLARRPAACWTGAGLCFLAAVAVQPGDLFISLYGPAAHLAIGGACALLVLPAALGSGATGVLRDRRVVWLGTVSYGIYLWHLLILELIVGAPVRPPLAPHAAGPVLALLTAVAGGAIAFGAASWYLAERPLARRVQTAGPAASVARA